MQWLVDLVYEMVVSNLTGIIVAWSGSVASIPEGWALCDGTQGTPNLTGRFIRSYQPAQPPGTIGGDDSHSHSFSSDSHYHDLFLEKKGTFAEGEVRGWADSRVVTGDTNSASHLPWYFVLAYIMKL